MTTALDIVDTAVKIGLGALISGLATYFVSKGKWDHEIRKEFIADTIGLIKEVSLKSEKSISSLNEFIHIFYCVDLNKEIGRVAILEKSSSLKEALDEGNQAQAIASMIGESDLENALDTYTAALQKLHGIILPDLSSFDPEEGNATLKIIKNSTGDIREAIRKSYKSIAKNA